MCPRGCYFQYQRGRPCPFTACQGGIGLDGGAARHTHIYSRIAQRHSNACHTRTDTHNTHADAHTHGTCTSKGNRQQIIATPQHTTPKTDSPSNTSSYACRMPPHAHLPQTWPRPKRTTPPVSIAVVQWLACLCCSVERTSHRPSDETYGRLHWGGWSGEKK